jgi:hypothetical protein
VPLKGQDSGYLFRHWAWEEMHFQEENLLR